MPQSKVFDEFSFRKKDPVTIDKARVTAAQFEYRLRQALVKGGRDMPAKELEMLRWFAEGWRELQMDMEGRK
jgi:hypothetical protein